MHAAGAAAAAAAWMRACVAACVIDTVYQLVFLPVGADPASVENRIFRTEISKCFVEILLALTTRVVTSRTSSGHRVPSREDFQNTSIFLYENSILYAWTKCTFGSVFSTISVLIDRFPHVLARLLHACTDPIFAILSHAY